MRAADQDNIEKCGPSVLKCVFSNHSNPFFLSYVIALIHSFQMAYCL